VPIPEAATSVTGQQSERVPHLRWQEEEQQFLTAVEKHLATFLGPMAGIIARRVASKAKDPVELFTLLASTLQAETDRQAFLARKNELLRGLRQIQPTRESSPAETPTGSVVQSRASGSRAADLTPAAVRHASELLARRLGPVSRVLTERAAQRADCLRALYLILAQHLENPAERTRFLLEAGFPEP
jgi:serine/threonine-protein kinase